MMETTEPDLGVVVATEPAAQPQVPPEELSLGPGEPAANDMPAFEQATESAGEPVEASDAGDVPALEGGEAAETPASGAAEDLPAAETGAEEPQPAEDGR
jgi:hypothetical protein